MTTRARPPEPPVPIPATFRAADGLYSLDVADLGIRLTIDRLRRERHQLVGELSVGCDLAGARTVEGVLSVADFNVSSATARTDRAKLLAQRAQTPPEFDWPSILEEFCQRVLTAERTGSPAVSLRDVPRPDPADDLEIDSIRLMRRHPTLFFGDGGSAKSYLALFVAGQLAQRGLRVGFFDWELAAEDHRDRLERLFPGEMPDVRYVRCERPLVVEVDRLQRIRRDDALDYAVFDSVACACDGPPEAAEVASAYFRAVRQIGIGSLHIAHITKAIDGDHKPFGSVFWHNSARATWFIKLAEPIPGGDAISVGLYPRKANLSALPRAVGFEIQFRADQTIVRRIDLADVDDLAMRLPMAERIRQVLRRGPLSIASIAEQLDVAPDTIKKTVKRKPTFFTRVPSADGAGRIALVERRRTI